MTQEHKLFTVANLLVDRIYTEIQHLTKTTKCKIDENKTRYHLHFYHNTVSIHFIKGYNNDNLFTIEMAYKPKKADTDWIKTSHAFITYLKENCEHTGVINQLYKHLPISRNFFIDAILADLELESNI
jgi:hypothetical protein